MMNIIIHADDFGINKSVTACIDECINKGWVTETSLMVNMPYADQAVELARRRGYADRVGLHLNLTFGMPLTEPIKMFPRFCDKDGRFNKNFHTKWVSRVWLPASERRALRIEIEEQIVKFCNYSGLMKKIDSHHHSHTDLPVYQVLKELGPRYGFDKMRISATAHRVSLWRTVYKSFLNRSIRNHFNATDEFDGFCDELLTRYSRGGNGDIEIMTHPMYSTSGEVLDTKALYADHIEALRAIGWSPKGCERA